MARSNPAVLSRPASLRRRLARRALIVLPAAASLFASAGALAQNDKDKNDKPHAFTSGPVLVIDHVALDKFLVDPKDRPLAEALGMLPARVRELPREVRQAPAEAFDVLNMTLAALTRPGRIAVTYSEAPTGGAFGYGVVFSVLTDNQQDADQMHAKISAMLKAGNPKLPLKASKRFEGMTDFQTPVAILSFGPRQAKDGWRYEVVFGTMDDPDAVVAALPKAAKGMEPTIRARFDLGGLDPAIAMAQAAGGGKPEVNEAITALQKFGVGGEHALKVSYQAGFTDKAALSYATLEGAKSLPLSTETLTDSDLAAVPSDAVSAFLLKGGAGLEKQVDALAQRVPQVQEGLDQFRQATGVDFRNDVVAALGGTIGLYMADATGGGSIGSAVFMVSVRDRAKFASALNKLATVGNMAADQIPIGPGYIRLTPWKDAGGDMMSLRFPGLPVPLEITIAMTDKWLIVAPTPQAAMVAARQATGKGDSGLTKNRAFSAMYKGDRKLMSVSFTDVPRGLRGSYPFLSMVGSMVSNMVRSPSDPSREPGIVVPLYADLLRDAKSTVSMSYWSGDDLVMETWADRSVLVHSGGSLGTMLTIAPMLAGGISAAVDEAKHKGFGLLPDSSPGASVVYTLAGETIPELAVARSALVLMGAAGVPVEDLAALNLNDFRLPAAIRP